MNILNYLQNTLHLSRRSAASLIQQGLILLNGKKVESFKQHLQGGDKIQLPNHLPHIVKPYQQQKKLILFNKPKGYTVSKSDPHNTTIYEILPDIYKDYYYIGRLDKDSRGLLLLTNAPELVHQYEHPKFNVEKEYLIQLSSPMDNNHQQQAKR